MKNELEALRNNCREDILFIKKELAPKRNNFPEEKRHIQNELKGTRDEFREEIREIRNDLEATRNNFHSILETLAYFGSLLSVQTTKGLFVHDLWKKGFHKDSVDFDLSTVKGIYISKNKKILSNAMFSSAVVRQFGHTLQQHGGAKANRKILQGEEFRLLFIMQYEFKKACTAENPFFVLSFCDERNFRFNQEKEIAHCWNMLTQCVTDTIHIFFIKEQQIKVDLLSPLTERTPFSFGFDINISGIHGSITYKDLLSGKELHTFNSVNFSESLIPFFGIFHREMVDCMIILI
ncbi:uncharacterized protein LOC133198616 [Saccostrea echinata]|uniref:uncharacterized protein LOC133198616 n=1 Tax=Saccostrea echinata TaxID=191078 RepID=UPI002A7FB226|nr:uncharacterized protein LOC133198616 [Saccostrea echinata]